VLKFKHFQAFSKYPFFEHFLPENTHFPNIFDLRWRLNEMEYRIIDENGIVVNTLFEGDRIVRKNSMKHLREEEGKMKLPNDEAFIKVFKDALPQLSSCGLSISESRIFFYLAASIRYESNVAKYDNGKLITRDNLCSDLNMSLSNVQRAIVRLCQRGLIAIAKIDIGKVFIVNPFVVMRGTSIDKTTYDLFKKTRWARNWDKPRS
jgi:hypothetical protein